MLFIFDRLWFGKVGVVFYLVNYERIYFFLDIVEFLKEERKYIIV